MVLYQFSLVIPTYETEKHPQPCQDTQREARCRYDWELQLIVVRQCPDPHLELAITDT